MKNKILHGDCLEELKKLSNDSVDCLVTDPPYGYSFMGKDWDKAVPSVEIWKECLRVLKPGAFAFVMSAPRQDVLSHMIVRLGEAGFKTDFTSLYWTYASGFPKAMNIGKMVDKRLGLEPIDTGIKSARHNSVAQSGVINPQGKGGVPNITRPNSEEAKALDGSYGGFQPKPAVEVIIVCMKPLSEKTYVDQALKNGKGITWLDDCRVPSSGESFGGGGLNSKGDGFMGESDKTYAGTGFRDDSAKGRFPANLIISDDVLNDGVERKTGSLDYINKGGDFNAYSTNTERQVNHIGDTGSYSRYFDLDKWAKTLPFLITPKASKREKNSGLEGFEKKYAERDNGYSAKISDTKEPRANNHPTVKPLRLMSYLITLGSRRGDVILDPFLGSGTTALAAKELDRDYIGIEREAEYVEISNARLNSAQEKLFV